MLPIETPNGIFRTCKNDVYVSDFIERIHLVFEHEIINTVLKPLIERSKYIVDVGANIGCHTVSYAKFNPDCKIWAFEPQSKLFDILCSNIELNEIKSQVTAFNVGLAEKPGTLNLCTLEQMYVPDKEGHNRGGAQIGKGGESMEIITLDSLDLPGLDFMKIDVEGAEGLVIQGASETLKKYKPMVFFEHNAVRINPEDVGLEHVPSPFEALTVLGYKDFRYIGDGNYITVY